MTVHPFDDVLREAESWGSWAEYAVWHLGEVNTGEPEFDKLIADLYTINENVHKMANQLALRYDLELFEGR